MNNFKFERDAKYFVIGFVAISLFFLMMGFVLSNSTKALDYGVREMLVDSHSTFSNGFLLFITVLFNNSTLAVLFLIAFVLLARAGLWKDGALLGASLAVMYAVSSLAKIFIARERPFGMLLDETGYSFPSGHALKATLFVLLFVFLYTESVPSFFGRRAMLTFGWMIIGLVCLSRLYFVVHWTSDVLAGFFLGLAAFCFAAWLRIKYEKLF